MTKNTHTIDNLKYMMKEVLKDIKIIKRTIQKFIKVLKKQIKNNIVNGLFPIIKLWQAS